MGEASLEEIAGQIINSGAVEVRDVDASQEPFVYSTGNRGPGYVMIKGLVGQRKVLKFLTLQLAHRVAPSYGKDFDFVEANATGGMIPGWQLADDIEKVLGLEEGAIPYVYLRGSRKEGGHGEMLTGDRNNPLIQPGMKALVFEELVNYAGTTTNAAEECRAKGYPVTHAGCILSYDHSQSNLRLQESGVTLTPLITLPQLLDVAEPAGLIPINSVKSYREFLRNPLEWQLSRGLVVPGGLERGIPKDSAKAAIDKGYSMRELSPEEALSKGAPKGKVNEGLVYWIKE